MKRWNHMGKLDASTQEATAVAVDIAALGAGGGVVNGPEDLLDWDAIEVFSARSSGHWVGDQPRT